MKTKKSILISMFLFCFLPFVFTQNSEVPTDLVSAFNVGNASKISSYLNTNVELVIGTKNDVFSKPQASGIITDFFRSNHVNSFQILHKGTKDTASFTIGELKTNSGVYRVYILTRKSANQILIQQLRIEPSND